MRERFRSHGFEFFAALIVLVALWQVWVERPTWKAVAVAVAICGLAGLIVHHHDQLRAARRRSDAAVANAEETAREAALAVTLAGESALAAAQETIANGLNATIVEVVAARQAVVRQAHPDDVMLRLTAAEDNAYEAITALDRLGAAAGAAIAAAPISNPTTEPISKPADAGDFPDEAALTAVPLNHDETGT